MLRQSCCTRGRDRGRKPHAPLSPKMMTARAAWAATILSAAGSSGEPLLQVQSPCANPSTGFQHAEAGSDCLPACKLHLCA